LAAKTEYGRTVSNVQGKGIPNDGNYNYNYNNSNYYYYYHYYYFRILFNQPNFLEVLQVRPGHQKVHFWKQL